MKRCNPNESLGFHCNLTMKAFLGAWEKKLKEAGITVSPTQLVALAQLFASGPLSQTELVKRLSITAASGVRLVDRMVRDDWVVRQNDAKDGRVKLVVPTKRATEFWEEISETGQAVMDQAYQGIKPSDIEEVKSILQKVRNNLER